MRHWPRLVITAVLGARLLAQNIDEYQVKAAFISNFANFIEWPPDAFKTAQDPLTVCVLGRNPFGSSLSRILTGKVVGGHPVELRAIEDAEAERCHVLFVSSSAHLRLRAILNGIRARSIFSVGDTNDFLAEGGIANLKTDQGRVRIEINAAAARAGNLHISSRLMSVAKIVN